MFYSHSTLDILDTRQGAHEELVPLNILCREFLCLIIQLAPVQIQALSSWPGRPRGTNAALPPPCDALIHAASPLRSLFCRRSPLCPLASINVMVHQWRRTLSQGRTPLLIWLLLMGENTINKFNYLWPISNGGDIGLLIMSSLKYEYEEI